MRCLDITVTPGEVALLVDGTPVTPDALGLSGLLAERVAELATLAAAEPCDADAPAGRGLPGAGILSGPEAVASPPRSTSLKGASAGAETPPELDAPVEAARPTGSERAPGSGADGSGHSAQARVSEWEVARSMSLLGTWLGRRIRDHCDEAAEVRLTLPGREPVLVPRAADREPTPVSVAGEWAVGLPVWGEFVTEHGIGALPPDLDQRLRAWNHDWEELADSLVTGAPAGALTDADVDARGRALAAELASVLGPDHLVTYDPD